MNGSDHGQKYLSEVPKIIDPHIGLRMNIIAYPFGYNLKGLKQILKLSDNPKKNPQRATNVTL